MKDIKKCIYLLEDNDDIREMLQFLLADDYDVFGYESIKSFSEVMKHGKPDMIILDVMLGDGNGFDVCNRLKQNSLTNHIPILMMSANAQFFGTKEKCNAEDFINKPFDIDDFVSRINKYIN